MTPEDHLALLHDGVDGRPGTWADLGSGTGAFTLALAALLGGSGRIVSVDLDRRALEEQGRLIRARFPGLSLELIAADFTGLSLARGLDGVVMANSLHFQKDARGVLHDVRQWLAPGGRLVIVEYAVERAGPWVPYPMPYHRLQQTAAEAEFIACRFLLERPSRYHGSIYSAVAENPGTS